MTISVGESFGREIYENDFSFVVRVRLNISRAIRIIITNDNECSVLPRYGLPVGSPESA